MKLNKKNMKKGLKNQMISIGHMIVFNIISFILFMASYIGTGPTGNIIGTSFIAVTEYKVNLFISILFWLLFLISFSFFYTKFLKKDLYRQLKTHWIFVVIFIICSIFFCFIEFILLIFAQLFNIGIFSSIVNFPDWIYLIILFYLIIYIIIDLIFERTKNKYKK